MAGSVFAGGGPENVLLVVNANSPGSKEVANHYAAGRDLPASNVLYLDYSGPLERISGERFRQEILKPILTAIAERKIGMQIDIIAYSTDFPWLVNLRKDFPAEIKFPRHMTPVASITGATYLYPFVLIKTPGIVQLDTNWYVPAASAKQRTANLLRCTDLKGTPSRAFRSRYAWDEARQRLSDPKKGRRYLMSTMLGVTTGRGNTVAEVIASLDRAVEAEASPPDGTFYFMRNTSPRSTPRHNGYSWAIGELQKLGAKARLKPGVVPTGAKDLLGLTTGDRFVKMRESNIRVLPGAITDNLTSYGGILSDKAHQTPLTDQIRDGATGSCGTVEEPTARQGKFPLPSLQVHYRRGCSLAEAFYQSVASPYQLLIVGDPLCQPWAKRPGLTIEGWPGSGIVDAKLGDLSGLGFEHLGIGPSKPTSPKPAVAKTSDEKPEPTGPPPALSIEPRVLPESGRKGGIWELFVDGRLRMRLPSERGVDLSAADLGPGWHDLRCVAIEPSALEGQQRQVGGITVQNVEGNEIPGTELRIDSSPVELSGRLAVSAKAAGAERIVIRQHSRVVATIQGDSGGAFIPAELLGRGRIRLQALAEPSGAASPFARAEVR